MHKTLTQEREYVVVSTLEVVKIPQQSSHYASSFPVAPPPSAVPLPTVFKKKEPNDIEKALVLVERKNGALLSLPEQGMPLWMCFKRHRFNMYVKDVLDGKWCGECIESLGEKVVREHIEKCKLEYRTEMAFPSLVAKKQLRFDLWIPSLHLLLEVDGEQHTESVKEFKGTLLGRLERDKIKDDWVREKGLSLLRLSYWELDEYETKIDEVIERLRKGEGPIIISPFAEWREIAIKHLKQKKKVPKAPIPFDAHHRAENARKRRLKGSSPRDVLPSSEPG